MEARQYAVAIYVLPTQEGMPPRARLMAGVVMSEESDDKVLVAAVDQHEAIWSRDMGTWTVDGIPVQQDLADDITAHAKDLGVEW